MFTDEELYGAIGTEEGTGQNPVTPTAVTHPAPDRQTEQGTTPADDATPKSFNWQESPEFKEWQRKHDTRYETLRQQADRERRETAQRLAQYEQMLEQLQTRDLDDVGKVQFENQKLKRILAAVDEQRKLNEGRQRVVSMIRQATQGVDLPEDVYAEAQDADEAWSKVAQYLLTQSVPQRAAALAEKKEANQVDLGGGMPSSADSDLQRRYDKAMTQFNAMEAYDIMSEADHKGIKLRL